MKRTAAVLFTIALLCALAACGRSAAEPSQNATATTEAADASQAEPKALSFQLPSLPDIGAYDGKTKVERWYDTFQDHLTARDDYGTLIPFIGAMQDCGYIEELQQGEARTAERYGLMTADGKIVVDAVYGQIYPQKAPNGETFYLLSGYDRRNVPASQVNAEEPGKRSDSCLIDTKGSKILKIPYSHDCVFTEDRIVLVPDVFLIDEHSKLRDSVLVYDMDFAQIATLSYSAMRGDSTDERSVIVLECGCLCFYHQNGCRFFDLEGNRILRGEKDVSYVSEFGAYMLLTFTDQTQKLVDLSGRDCIPTAYKDMSVKLIYGDSGETDEMLIVEQNDGFRCYDTSLRRIGPLLKESPDFAYLFGKLCYRSQHWREDALTYYELETGKRLDWSAYTKLDMSQYAQDYDINNTPQTVGDRYFMYSYSRYTDEGKYCSYLEVMDTKTGKIVLQSHDWGWDEAGHWLLLNGYYEASDDTLFDMQTQKTLIRTASMEVFEVDGTAYCMGVRNGYAFVRNLNTDETLLRMFVAAAG